MSEPAKVYRARKVYRDDGALLDDGAVACRDGRIAAVGPASELAARGDAVEDLGDVLLLPGLVNAHTHLRFTHLQGVLKPTPNFVGWLGRMALQTRLTRTRTFEKAVEEGARRLLAGGATTAVDIDMDGLSAATLRASPLRVIFAHECIDLDPRQAESRAADLVERIASLDRNPLRREHGIAPHAPYSVNRALFEAFARHLRDRPAFLTIHVAECAEEVEMLATGRGRIVKWLRRLRVLPRDWEPPRCSPVAFLERTGILDTPGVAAHCGRIDEEDAGRLARAGWAIAFCPGTHAFFGRPAYPLDRLRRAGVPVCVATDSAASNPSFCMMDEMRRVAQAFPWLSAAEIVAMATTIPARAIGWGEAVGRIAEGFCADLSAWSPGAGGDRLERGWFEGTPPTCVTTIIAGRRIAGG